MNIIPLLKLLASNGSSSSWSSSSSSKSTSGSGSGSQTAAISSSSWTLKEGLYYYEIDVQVPPSGQIAMFS